MSARPRKDVFFGHSSLKRRHWDRFCAGRLWVAGNNGRIMAQTLQQALQGPAITRAALKEGYALPLAVRVNPAITTMPDGRCFIIAGSIEGTKTGWLPVPPETGRVDLPFYVTWEPPTISNVWHVEGSTGNQYTVSLAARGAWSCTCPGFRFRGGCRHVGEVKFSLKRR